MRRILNNMSQAPSPSPSKRSNPLALGLLIAAAICIAAILFWQGITASGVPDPVKPDTSPTVATLDIGVLVFREGLECILVLAALTASMTGANQAHRRPVAVGAGLGFVGTLVTWFVAIGVMGKLTESVPALDLQAATGLLAVVVLLVVMNWFFHKLYWGGWIGAHNRKKKELLAEAKSAEISKTRLLLGLGLLGFTAFYREGFEVVLFLQTYYLKMGGAVVLKGAVLGGGLSAMAGVLTFVAQRKLPYRKMLICTGVMLGAVLLVMVGEQAQEMQLAHWISTTRIAALVRFMPDWMGLWFSVFPTVETLFAQGIAAVLVIGSYFVARRAGAASEDAPKSESSREPKSDGRNVTATVIEGAISRFPCVQANGL